MCEFVGLYGRPYTAVAGRRGSAIARLDSSYVAGLVELEHRFGVRHVGSTARVATAAMIAAD